MAHGFRGHRRPALEARLDIDAGWGEESVNSYFLILGKVRELFLVEVLRRHVRRVLYVRIRCYLVRVAAVELA